MSHMKSNIQFNVRAVQRSKYNNLAINILSQTGLGEQQNTQIVLFKIFNWKIFNDRLERLAQYTENGRSNECGRTLTQTYIRCEENRNTKATCRPDTLRGYVWLAGS